MLRKSKLHREQQAGELLSKNKLKLMKKYLLAQRELSNIIHTIFFTTSIADLYLQMLARKKTVI